MWRVFEELKAMVALPPLKRLRQSRFLGKADRILIYNTGSGDKYLQTRKQSLSGPENGRGSIA